MKIKYNLLLFCSLTFFACDEENKKEDITSDVNKNGSVESEVSVIHADSLHDVIITQHKIWVNYNEWKTVVHADTVPSLGKITETAENESGETQMVNVDKDYEIFITVK